MREEERLPIPSHRPLPEPVKEKKISKSSSKEKEEKPTKNKTKSKSKKKKEKKPKEKIDLWLDVEPDTAKDYSAMPSNEYENMNKKPKEKKSKSKEKKSKSKKMKDKQGGLLVKETYSEELEEVNSHSNNVNSNLVNGGFTGDLANLTPPPVVNNLVTLAEDKILKLVS